MLQFRVRTAQALLRRRLHVTAALWHVCLPDPAPPPCFVSDAGQAVLQWTPGFYITLPNVGIHPIP